MNWRGLFFGKSEQGRAGAAEGGADPRSGVVIYTTMLCPYCWRAKKLLAGKGVEYHEIDVGMSPDKRAEMMVRAGGRHTVPQIFVAGRHVGGSDELAALERAGTLDSLLAAG